MSNDTYCAWDIRYLHNLYITAFSIYNVFLVSQCNISKFYFLAAQTLPAQRWLQHGNIVSVSRSVSLSKATALQSYLL